eukprot:scaffold108180_cov66-Phaeocystis_antarctica.AAC.2
MVAGLAWSEPQPHGAVRLLEGMVALRNHLERAEFYSYSATQRYPPSRNSRAAATRRGDRCQGAAPAQAWAVLASLA